MKPTLYRHFDEDGKLLYVGITAGAGTRMARHQNSAPWYDDVKTIVFDRMDSMEEAAKAEIEAVIKENPLYNKIRFKSEREKSWYITQISKKYPNKHPLVVEGIKRLGGPGRFCEALGISRQALHGWGGHLPELRKFQIMEIIKDLPETPDSFNLRRRDKKDKASLTKR